MLVKDLRLILEQFPEDADIVFVGKITHKLAIVKPILDHYHAEIADEQGIKHPRLVLVNNKEVKGAQG